MIAGLGLAGTTPSRGARSPHKADWSPLAGKDVVILPDDDPPGEGSVKNVPAQLATMDPGPNVRVVQLADSYISALAMSKAPVKVIQSLARHSTPTLTLGTYAHVGLYGQTAALDALPKADVPRPRTEAPAVPATGTDGRTSIRRPLRFPYGGTAAGGSGGTLTEQTRRAGSRTAKKRPATSHGRRLIETPPVGSWREQS